MVLILVLNMSVCSSVYSEDASKLKVAFVFNFTKFVKWPNSVEEAGGELQICLLGAVDPDFFQIDGRAIRNFTLKIRQLLPKDNLSECRMLFVSRSADIALVLEQVENQAILTVGEGREFVDEQGMIGLYVQESRIRFDINYERAKASQLNISSKLLQLAGRVI